MCGTEEWRVLFSLENRPKFELKVSHETREPISVQETERESLACEVIVDFYFRQRKQLSLLPLHPRIWSPFNLLPIGYIEFYLLGRKQAKFRSRHLPFLSAKIKNVCSITCVFVCVCVCVCVCVWLGHRRNCTLTCVENELTFSIY